MHCDEEQLYRAAVVPNWRFASDSANNGSTLLGNLVELKERHPKIGRPGKRLLEALHDSRRICIATRNNALQEFLSLQLRTRGATHQRDWIHWNPPCSRGKSLRRLRQKDYRLTNAKELKTMKSK